MNINPAGAAIIKKSEGLRLAPYKCPAGVLTVGYGHTGKVTGPITEAQAEELFRQDVAKFERELEKLLAVEVNPNQFSAMVSLMYNIGPAAFAKSTLLKLVNQGKHLEAANQFPRWNKAGGRVLPGLVTRREEEKQLFLKDS